MFQEIVLYIVVGFALLFLLRKLIGKKSKAGCNDDCACH